MKKFKTILLAVLFLAIYQASAGAQNTAFEESISVHLAKTIAVAGEKVPVQVTLQLQGQASPLNFVYAELLSRDGIRYAEAIIPLENGRASAYVQITDETPSDHYLLRVYSRLGAKSTNPKANYQELITIINPEIPPTRHGGTSVSPGNTLQLSAGELGIDMASSSMGRAQTAKLKIKAPSQGKVNLSISLKNPYSSRLVFQEKLNSEPASSSELIPEIRGHIIQGQATSSPVDTLSYYLLSAHGKQSELFLSRPNAEGEIYFDLGVFKLYDFLILQSERDSVAFDFHIQSPFASPPDLSWLPKLEIDEEDQAWLDQWVLGQSIARHYLAPLPLPQDSLVTGFTADLSYLLDDYNRFEDMGTTFKEYFPTVMVRKSHGKTHFKLINKPLGTVFDENPLMLIDGMPVFDSDQLAKFHPKNIRQALITNREYYIRNKSFKGVLDLKSYQNDFAGYPLPENALYLEYPSIQQEVIWDFEPSGAEEQVKAPDLRDILLWQSNIFMEGNGEKEWSFTTSELAGTYEIVLSYTDTQGNHYQKTKTFTVL